MTQEEKELLLKDLCARLPYGVKVDLFGQSKELIGVLNDIISVGYDINDYEDAPIEDIKPYLRPMSSITEEEIEELKKLSSGVVWRKDVLHDIVLDIWYNTDSIDWLNKKGFDYRGLIPMGLALPATEDMYNK